MTLNIILGTIVYGTPLVLCMLVFAIVGYEIIKLKKSHAIWWALPNIILLELMAHLFLINMPIRWTDGYFWLFVWFIALAIGIYSFVALFFMRKKYSKLKPVLIVSGLIGVALLLASCAPTTGLKSMGANRYTLTEPSVRFQPIKPQEEKLVAQAKAMCAQQGARYHYLQTHIKHPTGYGPHYTLEFECQPQHVQGSKVHN